MLLQNANKNIQKLIGFVQKHIQKKKKTMFLLTTNKKHYDN